ncbi:glycosyltransferase [Bacillus sp. FJAT-42315]|uniref:glycosyltransferase n=1 Tax=Bacillus sp. FJAT-42315 TaxID=2014077 RepID=UPI000C24F91A|nr:glycosyltransferase [Bacillus sp. FJAT-42315]
MNILYFGSLCDKEWFEQVCNNNRTPSRVAQFMFETALVEGFSKYENIQIDIHYLYQEPYYPKGKFLKFKGGTTKLNQKDTVRYIPRINLPLIKEFYSFFQGMLLTTNWSIKQRKNKQKLILTPFNYTPLSLGILVAAKLLRIKRVNIFTDMSTDILTLKRQKDMPWFKRMILPLYMKLVNFVEHQYDGYVLFTEPMNKKVNPKNKPFIVMEGIFNNDLDLSEAPKSKAVMYAGTLAFEYGVKNILDAFEQIHDDDLELWLFGDGDMREYIEQLSMRDRRVKFFGFKPRSEVFEYEKRATLLINARNPEDEYTMYSFPSKTFEYMVSGTPFLTTNLKCIPEEYQHYLYIVDKNNNLKNTINNIINKSPSELKMKGEVARQFILKNKNSAVQASKIVQLIQREVLN